MVPKPGLCLGGLLKSLTTWAIPLSFVTRSGIGSSAFVGSRRVVSTPVVCLANTYLTPAPDGRTPNRAVGMHESFACGKTAKAAALALSFIEPNIRESPRKPDGQDLRHALQNGFGRFFFG
jgi:hypothetical protein